MNETMFESGSPILPGGIGVTGAYGRAAIVAVLKCAHETEGRKPEQMED